MCSRLAVVRGGGDLGSGVALRLWRCGFDVIILETERPLAVRRTVAFAEAVYEGAASVEEAQAVLVPADAVSAAVARSGVVAVVVDPKASVVPLLQPTVMVDAIMAKKNRGTSLDMAEVVVALGPGFEAGTDCHAVVETNRGPHLGRVLWRGQAMPNTGEPGRVEGVGKERVLRAPSSGTFRPARTIGDMVNRGDAIAQVGGLELVAPFTGLVRGLLRGNLEVMEGMKVGDLDPRLDPTLCNLVSDKALAIGGGVLEAVFSRMEGRRRV